MNPKPTMKNVSDDLRSLEWYFEKGLALIATIKNMYRNRVQCDLNEYCDINGKEDFDNLKKCYYLFSPETKFISDETMITEVINTNGLSAFDDFDNVLKMMKINLIKKFSNVLDNKLVVKLAVKLAVKEPKADKVVRVIKDEIFDMPKPAKVSKSKKVVMLDDLYKKISTKKNKN